MRQFFLCLIYVLAFTIGAAAQDHSHDHNHDHSGHNHSHDHSGHAHDSHAGHDHAAHASHDGHGHGDHACGFHHETTEFDPVGTAFHHIADANVYSIGPLQLPLPCFLYAPSEGLSTFLSSKFNIIDSHGNGDHAYNSYVLDAGTVVRVPDASFPKGHVKIDGITHKQEVIDDKERTVSYVCYAGKQFRADAKSTLDGGLFGGGITSFYDFSMTKNVVSMLLVCLFLAWLFFKVAKAYVTREGKAPSGVQSFVEPIFVFIQDEVAKPFLGHKWEKFTPFLMAIFFFILGLNLFGQIPFFGGSNVTGNLSVTLVLAVIASLVTNLNGNAHYWKHIFNMPGVPFVVKLILTPVEFLGLLIKPITLMLRLFANITAGHMVIIIFIGLIFTFGKMGMAPGAGYATVIPATLLTLFMMTIELLVAFLQAFVFTILTASYIGAAVEEDHH